jgi:hypothetical protein
MLQHWGEKDRTPRSAKDVTYEWTLVALAVPAVIAQVLLVVWSVLHLFG